MSSLRTVAMCCALLLSIFGASCANDPGPQGQEGKTGTMGTMGAMGEPGAGWTESGNDLYLNKTGNLGVGTNMPMAKLHVLGRVIIDEDASLLAKNSWRAIQLDQPNAGDLGDQLNPLLAKYRNIVVMLKKNTTWVWNKRVELARGQSLELQAEEISPDALDKTPVFIRMTMNDKWVNGGVEYKSLGRVVLLGHAIFHLQGINLVVATNDTRPLTYDSTNGAIITSAGPFNHIVLWYNKITTSEDLVNIGVEGMTSLNLSSLKINKDAGATRDIFAVKAYYGWNIGPGFGFVGYDGVTLGAGVSYAKNPSLMYNPPLP